MIVKLVHLQETYIKLKLFPYIFNLPLNFLLKILINPSHLAQKQFLISSDLKGHLIQILNTGGNLSFNMILMGMQCTIGASEPLKAIGL